ncbi:MAG: phytoene desaturase family protein [Candidatus Heimdallarchaeaceae archaeon]
MDSENYDVIIIGSGMGGLGAGLKLQSSNPELKTLILEQHSIPGGFVTGFKRKGYYFDSGAEGLVYCGEGQAFRMALDKFGVDQEYISIDPVETMQFPNKKIIMYANGEKYKSELIENFPNEQDEIRNFFRVIESIQEEFLSVVKGKFDPSFKELIKIVFTCPTIRKYATKSFDDLLTEFITNAELRDILAVYCLWLGVSAKKIKATLAAVVFFSPYYQGHYYPKGGMLAFANNLAKTYTVNGGEIRYKTKAKKIIIENGKAVGVQLGDECVIKGKWIISNSDIQRTTFDLIGKENLSDKYIEHISGLEKSVTGFAVFLGLGIHLDDYPSHIAYNIKSESYLERIAKGNYDPEEVLIRIPDRIDPSLRNDKGSSIIILTFAPYSLGENWGIVGEKEQKEQYTKIKEKYTERLIQITAKVIPDITKHIVYKDAATPLTFERYTLNLQGAWYGVKKGQKRPKQQTPIKNLLLAGGNTQGAGVPSCFFSGIKAGEMILKKLEKKK